MKTLFKGVLGLALGVAVTASPAFAQKLTSVDNMKRGDTWELVFGSASATGTYFAGMSALTAMLSEKMPNVRATATISPGSAIEVFPQLQRAERAGGMHVSYDLDLGYKGEGPFTGKEIPVRSWFFAQEAVYNVFVDANSGVTSVYDLKGSGMKIGGPVIPISKDHPERWDNAFAFINALLTAHGIDPFEDVEVLPYNTSQSIEELGNGNIGGLSASRAYGSGAITELSTRRKVRLLQPDPEKAAAVEAAFPAYMQPFDPEIYPMIEIPAPGMAFFHGVYAVLHRDLPDDLAYDLTKTVWENIDVLRQAHPAFKNVSLETALKGVTVPPHPGALRYYLENDVPGAQDWADKLASEG
ncbi:TAXI family TRAP transporter solute-binding subunit [Puniceibacterium sp. IMCC21224]|uniref:TAXI family TRAP transporter solute-binding subunit n=1 Tax=Puniceibacterium sp. IMCC21224 TaxID=1618204 RepID=UPI00064DF078|nr:TAXI family TRAP transporter solute-binding subunit [Puniceibacterium sp. IMCC21224]KMK64938.1 TRAP transporter solute receptor, TAXI family [Puniceibacterium sp. IMCC21224]